MIHVGTGISVEILRNFDHGVFSCSIDGNGAQYFNANGGVLSWAAGCTITGLTNQKHTIVIANSPLSGWWLTIGNITVSSTVTTTTNTSNLFSSDYGVYAMPATLIGASQVSIVTATVTATITGETVVTATASASASGQTGVSVSAVAAACTVLAITALVFAILAFVFRRQGQRYMKQCEQERTMEATPLDYTVAPYLTGSSGIQSSGFDGTHTGFIVTQPTHGEGFNPYNQNGPPQNANPQARKR